MMKMKLSGKEEDKMAIVDKEKRHRVQARCREKAKTERLLSCLSRWVWEKRAEVRFSFIRCCSGVISARADACPYGLLLRSPHSRPTSRIR